MKIYRPMLAKQAKEMPHTDRYIFEPKYDGIRAIAYLHSNGSHTLINRSGNDVTARFPEVRIESAVEKSVYDGELVCYNEEGVPDFQLMQTRMNRKNDIGRLAQAHPATFMAFDMLELDGEDITDQSLYWRRRHLDITTPNATSWWSHEDVEKAIDELSPKGWEGIMVKDLDSKYQPGIRSPHWLKVKFLKQLDAVVLGYTQGFGRRLHSFGALLLGLEVGNGEIVYIGECGTGFKDSDLESLKRLIIDRKTIAPATAIPASGKVYCRPDIIIRVQYLEISSGGILRFPAYKGMVECATV